jgi:hypothetical protein
MDEGIVLIMKRRNLTICAGMIALIAILATVRSDARVFLRWGSTNTSSRTLTTLGGTRSYEADVAINQGTGRVSVFGYHKGMDQLLPDLLRAFKFTSFDYQGGSMASASIENDDTITRFIIVQLTDSQRTLVFALEQSASQSDKSSQPPMEHLMPDIPAFPGSSPTFYARDDNTGMSLAISTVVAEPASIREFYSFSLAASGWMQPFPVQSNDAGMTVFLKANHVACVNVETPEDSALARITLLHKKQRIE